MRILVVVMMFCCTAAITFAQQKNVERGKYITENVAMCIQCHTPRDASGDLIRSQVFGGASIPVGRPVQIESWSEFAPRIAGLPQYTEQEMIRLLTTGIGREGKSLRSPMPTFRMTTLDAEDVTAYLKSLK